MGIFDDKKFEQLDWMTQITETIDSELNGLLARLPDEKTFDMQSLLALLDNSYSLSISSGNLVRLLLREIEPLKYMDYTEETRLIECFKFECSDRIELNFDTMEMTGSVKLVKVTKTLEDEDLQKMMGHKGLESLRYVDLDVTMCGRANEILDLIDAHKDCVRTRSINKKVRAVRDRLRVIFTNNEWRIRDMDLADKISLWCRDYIRDGSLAALMNLAKLKVMTHNSMPIYSIEEEK